MFLLRTRGDVYFFLALSALIFAMGLVFWLSPLPPLPREAGAYVPVEGTLDKVTAGSWRRADPWVAFRLQGVSCTYEYKAPGMPDAADAWMPGVSHLSFHVLSTDLPACRDGPPVRVYGLTVGMQVWTQRSDDIERLDPVRNSWFNLFPLGLGLAGGVVGVLTLRRMRR